MKFAFFLLIIAVCSWWFLNRSSHEGEPTNSASLAALVQNGFDQSRLAQTLKAVRDWASKYQEDLFTDIEMGPSGVEEHSLQQWAKVFAEEYQEAVDDEKKHKAQLGYQYCLGAIRALNEQASHADRLIKSRERGYEDTTVAARERAAAQERKKQLFEGNIFRSWEESATPIRKYLSELQQQL